MTWITATLIRAGRTAAQAALGVLGTGVVDLVDVDLANLLAISGGAALVSILTSAATGLPEVDTTHPTYPSNPGPDPKA